MAGVNDPELSVYLNRKATAWYRRFPPIHSPDRAKDTKKATVASGDEQGEASSECDNDEDAAARPVMSGSEYETGGEGED